MTRKYLKRMLLMTVLLTVSSAGFSQVYELQATHYSERYEVDEYDWSEWTENIDTSLMITVDLTDNKITIASEETQGFDIDTYEGKSTDEEGDDTYSYYCVDDKGRECRIEWVVLNSRDGRMQIYVYYRVVNWLFEVYSLH